MSILLLNLLSHFLLIKLGHSQIAPKLDHLRLLLCQNLIHNLIGFLLLVVLGLELHELLLEHKV